MTCPTCHGRGWFLTAPDAFPEVCVCTVLSNAERPTPMGSAEEESEVTDEISLLDETSDDYRTLAASHLRRTA